MKVSKFLQKMINIDIIMAVILAVLITCELKVEEDIRRFMNSATGLILSIMITILFFIYSNPLVALLFLFYFYENVKHDNLQSGIYDKYTKKSVLDSLLETNKITQKKQDLVEIDIIKSMAPIVKKRENSVSFTPNDDNIVHHMI